VPNIVAVFLFNHRFEKNLPKLDELYRDRFKERRYIMPFARSERPDVISVFETSWNFSGHLAQAWPRFRVEGASHYVIIADDLILNPRLNEENIIDELNIFEDGGYIKSIASIDRNRYLWYRALLESIRLDELESGFDYVEELPSANEALKRFEAMGIPMAFPGPPRWREVRLKPHRVGAWNYLRWIGRRTSYPLLYGYSDFIIVPAHAMPSFIRSCGVFAALNIFAEVAVPTSLALSVDKIQSEMEFGEHFEPPAKRRQAALEGLELWGTEQIDAFVKKADGSLAKLLSEFPDDRLYVHPVKLSQFC